MKTCISLLFLLTAPLSVISQSTKTNTVAQITSYAKSIDRMTDRRKEPDLVIADVSDYATEKPEWRKFKSVKELEAFREKTETYTVAYNWRSNSKIVSSVFTAFSPSGDWAQYVTHYFRPDGSAAKINAEMRTFNGDYIIIREYYFGARGNLLKKTAKYLDLTTKKPKKPTAEMLDEKSDFYRADYYKKVSLLPYYLCTKAT